MEIARVFRPARSKYLVFTADYLLPLFICLGVMALAYLALYSPFFQITSITCSLDYEECQNPSVIAELDKLKGQNIFTFPQSTLTTRLTSGDFTIRAVTLKRELPSSVIVDLQSVYPVVALQVEGDLTWVVLDPQFRVIGQRGEDPNVPTVLVSGPLTLTIGQAPGDQVLLQTLSLAIRLADELLAVKTITLVDGDTIQLTMSDGVTAIFTPQKDETLQLRALQAVLAETTIRAGVSTIDVRFARPVLR